MLRLLPSLLSLALLAACPGRGGEDTDPSVPWGCITVDGGGGYANLADAVAAARDGSEIELCRGIFRGSATIDRPLTLVGPDRDQAVLSQGDGSAVLTVEGVALTLRSLSIESEGDGIVAEGATLALDDVKLGNIGGRALVAKDGTTAIDDLLVSTVVGGGLYIDGGSLTMTDSLLSTMNSYGLRLENGVDAHLEGNHFHATYYTGNSNYLFVADGIALAALDSTVRSVGNVFTENSVAAIQLESSTLESEGDEIETTYVGLLTLDSTLDVRDAWITGTTGYGAYLRTSDVTVDGLLLETDPETSTGATGSTATGSRGLYAIGSDLAVSNSTISGNNGGGIEAFALDPAELIAVTLDGVVLEDNARYGLLVEDGTLTATDVTVRGMRNRDEGMCDGSTLRTCNHAVSLETVDATWTGGGIETAAGDGFVVEEGLLDTSGLTVTDVAGIAFRGQDTAILLDGATVTGFGEAGLRLDASYGGLTGSTFSGGRYDEQIEEEVSEEQVMTTITYAQSRLALLEESTLVADQSAFSDNEWGIEATDSTLTLSEITFGAHERSALALSGGSATVSRSTFDGVGGEVLMCDAASLSLDNVDVSDVGGIVERTETRIDDEVVESAEETLIEPAVVASGCQLILDDLTITGAVGSALVAEDGSLAIDDATLSTLRTASTDEEAAISLRWTTQSPDVFIDGLAISDVQQGDALSLVVADGLGTGFAELSGTTVGDGIAGNGIVLSGATVTFRTLDLSGTGAAGLTASDGAVTLEVATVRSTGAQGLSFEGGTHSLTTVTVEEAGGYGLECDTEASFPTCDVTADAKSCAACP